jgi:hypothetical protein
MARVLCALASARRMVCRSSVRWMKIDRVRLFLVEGRAFLIEMLPLFCSWGPLYPDPHLAGERGVDFAGNGMAGRGSDGPMASAPC